MKKILLAGSIVLLLAGSVYAFNQNDAKCTGSDNCKACKNCKYCKHCSKDGNTCGVCK
ncbi:hypothetical protein [Flavobacterium sp. LAR06]|uniref:hypothetical protein n=1 Tax=Flavobacterium sp. LAR06 TaxID=3064897 RepID=UPI0035C0F628